MSRLWAESLPVSCCHPGADPLLGRTEILNSWRQIFLHGQPGRYSGSCRSRWPLIGDDRHCLRAGGDRKRALCLHQPVRPGGRCLAHDPSSGRAGPAGHPASGARPADSAATATTPPDRGTARRNAVEANAVSLRGLPPTGILTPMKLSRIIRRRPPSPPPCLLPPCLAAALASWRCRLARADYGTGLDAFNAGAFDQAFADWQKAALTGDKRAQHALGLLLESGRGTKADLAQAVKWYEASAEQGFAPAMNNLAMLYAEGRGVKKDQNKAIAYWSKAAEGGNATAEFNLGVQYMLGEGVPRDQKQTVTLWTKSADAGNVQAQYNLGLLYDRGDGVKADEKQAAHWIAKAAEAGLAEAQIDLAEFYRTGRGVNKDPDQAYQWLEKAASPAASKPSRS